MQKLLLLLTLSLSMNAVPHAQITSTDQLLDAMQVKNRSSWFKEFTFRQETIRYNQNGSIRDTAIWYEAVSYPDHFRIDYNDQGRFVIFRNDSSYRFQNYALQSQRIEPQEFLLFKGGMYFMSPVEVKAKLKTYGYDTSVFREDRLNGKKAYVVGAKKGDLKTKQFWIDADHYFTVRRISDVGQGRILDVQYSDHKRVNGGWVEQKVTFYLNERLLQVENYLDINANLKIPPNVFNPFDPSKSWFK
ncbi:LolA-like protein [Roseivirga misakiensis]|uniref:Outer membrane lipoprotein-sorting protein n=1 Tax=Roseivirga misakiensis TaxID=1563681 RepID=A0A1E5T0B0_9BACT|nr:hypothetical protein [Roseivirga misakiensis]OEK04801.1 hypothetical protein BFP71_15260 [Roseivirga misakiensis]